MDPQALRVLLVEDDPDLGSALTEFLELSGLSVDWARSGLEFYRFLGSNPDYHVGVIDLGLPDQPGMVLGDYLRRNTMAGVIILTASDSRELTAESYNLGMDLFIGKPVDNSILVSAISSVAQRSLQRMERAVEAAGLASARATKPAQHPGDGGPWRLHGRRRLLVAPNGRTVNLGRRELKVLQLFTGNPERTASRRQQLLAAYNRDDESAQRALDTLMSRLRRKITDNTRLASPIITDHGFGHSFSEPLAATD